LAGLLRRVDAVVLRVPSLERGLAFYRDQLGHELIWRTGSMIGLRLGRDGTELVLSLDTGPETDMLVESVGKAVESMVRAGGSVIVPPDDIPVGRVAVVGDPFGNELTLVDLSKGTYLTDALGNVMGLRGAHD
jgi:catechol 2,3-dioxygenase-like lactoylglutathione lyase family enzyme